MTRDEQIAHILDILAQGPRTTPELIKASGIKGAVLGNMIKTLLRDGRISREQISAERFRYYIGNTAPGWTGYTAIPKPAERPRTAHRVPVKVVDVSRSYFADAVPIRITLPAAPWECVA